MKNVRFIAYLQSFSNTHGPAERLATMVAELIRLPDLAGLAIGTRPDCLDEEKLEILATAPVDEVWLDLGLQSANDSTLKALHRGHSSGCFATWARNAAQSNLKVCAHVITGLPGEVLADFKQTMLFVNNLPVAGIKIHNLFIPRGTRLEHQWSQGKIELLSRTESVTWLIKGLELLRPDIVVHRLNSDPTGDELIAPNWAGDKRSFLDEVAKRMECENSWQGKAIGYPLSPWFTPHQEPHP